MTAETPQPPVGIDLGTTYSVTAYLDATGRPVTVRNGQGDLITPSAIFVDQDDILVGKQAVKSCADAPDRYAECFKRDMGLVSFRHKVRGLDVPPEVLSAMVLKRLKEDAEQRLNAPVQSAVVTVPAFFDAQRRGATQEAGRLAGLNVLDIINEPTAAALAYGYQAGFLNPAGGPAARQRVLVYDLGGGTFDVTVLEIDGARFHAMATDGDVFLGGKDFDERIVNYVAQQFLDRHGVDPRSDPQDAAQLWQDAQEAKHALSERTKTTVTCFHAGIRMRVEIDRTQFDDATRDLLERTETTASLVVRQAGLDWPQIDRVLLVGGSSRMPMVVRMLRALTGKEPDCSQSPDEAVAHGAALYAGMIMSGGGDKPSCELVNVNSHSLGVVGIHPKSGQRAVSVLIPKNTPLPCKVVKAFRAAKADMRGVSVPVVEGESERPEECILLGECAVRDLPPGLPQGARIEVEYRYAANGRISVYARVPSVRYSAHVEIDRDEVRDLADVATWRARLLSGVQGTGAGPATAAGPTVDMKDEVSVRKRLDAVSTEVGRAAAAAPLAPGTPEKLARSHQLALAAASTLRQAEDRLHEAERACKAGGGGREVIELGARLSQARTEFNQARTRADFAHLVFGRECLSAGTCPPGLEGFVAEARRLRQALPRAAP
ncbi:MAG: Hsp70 family protein [Thermoguttaceae bacterium]